MALINKKNLKRHHKPQGYYYKHDNRWVKFYLEYEDGMKWNLYCQSLNRIPDKSDFEIFIKQTGVNYINS